MKSVTLLFAVLIKSTWKVFISPCSLEAVAQDPVQDPGVAAYGGCAGLSAWGAWGERRRLKLNSKVDLSVRITL